MQPYVYQPTSNPPSTSQQTPKELTYKPSYQQQTGQLNNHPINQPVTQQPSEQPTYKLFYQQQTSQLNNQPTDQSTSNLISDEISLSAAVVNIFAQPSPAAKS